MKRKQNGEIIIEVKIKMCLTVQNINTISAKHFLGARVESGLSSFFWEYALLLLKGVKTISTFINDIKCLSEKKALNSHAKAYFSNDIS